MDAGIQHYKGQNDEPAQKPRCYFGLAARPAAAQRSSDHPDQHGAYDQHLIAQMVQDVIPGGHRLRVISDVIEFRGQIDHRNSTEPPSPLYHTLA